MKKNMKLNLHSLSLALLLCFGITEAQVPNYVPTNGLLGWWPLDNSPVDTYTNNLGGSITGTPLTVSGHLGTANTAYQFNGADYIQVADNSVLSNFNDMSISLWVKANSSSGVSALVTKWYQWVNCNGLSDTYGVYMTGATVNYANVNEVFNGFPTPPSLSTSDLNTWTHIVCTSDALAGQKIYINAVLAATNPSSSLGPICATTGPLMFGAETQQWVPPIHRYLTGSLDDIGIWNRVLTVCEIENLYRSSFMYSPSMYSTGVPTILTNTSSTSNSTTLTANMSFSNTPTSFQWYVSGNSTSFASSQSIVVNPSVTTVYSVIVGAPGQCPGTRQATVQPRTKVSITENNLPENLVISIAPNPNNGIFTLSLNQDIGTYDVRIKSLDGRLIQQRKCSGVINDLDIKNLSPAIYFLEIQTNETTLLTRKIIRSE